MVTVKSLLTVTIRSLTGHIVTIPALTPTSIPDILLTEARAAGCVPVSELESDGAISAAPLPAADPAPKPARKPANVQLRSTILDLIREGDTVNFKGDGTPKVAVVAKLLDEPVTAVEVLEAYLEVKDYIGA